MNERKVREGEPHPDQIAATIERMEKLHLNGQHAEWRPGSLHEFVDSNKKRDRQRVVYLDTPSKLNVVGLAVWSITLLSAGLALWWIVGKIKG